MTKIVKDKKRRSSLVASRYRIAELQTHANLVFSKNLNFEISPIPVFVENAFCSTCGNTQVKIAVSINPRYDGDLNSLEKLSAPQIAQLCYGFVSDQYMLSSAVGGVPPDAHRV
jgi:hypothetical protein